MKLQELMETIKPGDIFVNGSLDISKYLIIEDDVIYVIRKSGRTRGIIQPSDFEDDSWAILDEQLIEVLKPFKVEEFDKIKTWGDLLKGIEFSNLLMKKFFVGVGM